MLYDTYNGFSYAHIWGDNIDKVEAKKTSRREKRKARNYRIELGLIQRYIIIRMYLCMFVNANTAID